TKENFRASFDPKRVEVERDLDNLPNVPKTQIQAAVDNLVQRIQLLEKAVTDNISILPPYDTRICLEAVKLASERLSVLRGQLVPRQKFSFKSRKTVATATSPSALQVSNAATSATATHPSAMMVDTETIYLGGVQVNNNTTASAPAVLEKPKDVALTNLTDCTINLVHTLPLGAIHIKNLKRCVLVIPPVSGSILLHDCEGCTLIGACHQSRMHTSTNMDIYLHVTSEPIIEDCTDMRFAPYPPEKNLFDHVKDFNWLRQQQSPNWRLLDASEIRQGVAHHVLYTQRA
ncbi:TBCC-domain-containing protein, partial [Linnemannia elongata AG-77]